MQFQKKEKRQTTVRFDSHHVRLSELLAICLQPL